MANPRMAERIAREGGATSAAGLLAGRLVRAHSVALAAELRDRPNHTLARRMEAAVAGSGGRAAGGGCAAPASCSIRQAGFAMR